MDFGKAFLFVTEDDSWIKKIAIGAVFILFSWLVIPIFFVIGYQVAVIRRVMKNDPDPLPEWEEWGTIFMDGAVVGVAMFVYALPVILLALCSMVIWLPAATGNDVLAGGAVLGVVVIACLLFLFAIALAFIVPALYIQYARNGDFGSMFRVGDVIAISRENFVNILLVILVTIVANFLLGLVTWIPVCGWFVLAPAGNFWIMVAVAYLYGQIAGGPKGDKLEAGFETA
jgi:hypothetical protein